MTLMDQWLARAPETGAATGLREALVRGRFRGRDKDASRRPRDRSSRDDLRRHDQTLIDRWMRSRLVTESIRSSKLSLRAEGPSGLGAITNALQSLREEPADDAGRHCGHRTTSIPLGSDGYAADFFRVRPTRAVATRRSRSRRGRPSGTEPKLKAYIEITSPPSDATSLAEQRRHGGGS